MDIENIQSKLFIGIWKSENKDMTVVPITTENSCTLWCNQVPSLRNAIWEKPAHINIARNNRILFQHSDSNRPVTSNRSFRSPTDLTQLRLAWNKNCSVFYCAVKLQNSFCDALYNFSSHKQTTKYIYIFLNLYCFYSSHVEFQDQTWSFDCGQSWNAMSKWIWVDLVIKPSQICCCQSCKYAKSIRQTLKK